MYVEMDSALLEMPTRVAQPFEVGTLGAFDATASGETRVIKRKDEDLLRQITETLDKQLLAALACRTPKEFAKARGQLWEMYFRARRTLGDTIKLVIPKNVIEIIRFATTQRIAEDLARSRDVLFREDVAAQFEFTDWLVNKIQCVAHEISKAGNPSDRAADSQLHEDFSLYTSWGQFHYDCVLASMKFDRPSPEQIQGSIRDGLRAWVNACSITEEALALRAENGSERPQEVFDLPWDEEDQELLDSSMRDLDAEFCSDL